MTGHEWKSAVATVDDDILKTLHKIVCRQTNCFDRGYDEKTAGQCAACADIAENVVGEFLLLSIPAEDN